MSTHPELAAAVREIADEMRAAAGPRRRSRPTFPNWRASIRKHFGLAVIDAEGNVAAGGDADTPFSIQSISKVFTLTLALGQIGDRLWRRVGREPSGSPFNSIVQLEREHGIPRNPFINAGAIAVTDLILSGHQPREALGEILRFMQFPRRRRLDRDRRSGRGVRAAHRLPQRRARQLHEVVRRAREPGRATRSASISTTAPSRCRAASWRWPGASSRIRAQSRDRPAGRPAGARAAHQRGDADLRPL